MLCIPPAILPKVEGLALLRWSSLSTPPAPANLLGVGGRWSSHPQPPALPEGPEPCQNSAKAPARGGNLQEAWISQEMCCFTFLSLALSWVTLAGKDKSLVLLFWFWQVFYFLSLLPGKLLACLTYGHLVSCKSTALVI